MFRFLIPMDNVLNSSTHLLLTAIVELCDYDEQSSVDPSVCPDYSDLPPASAVPPDFAYRRATLYCALIMLFFCLIGIVGNCVSIAIFTRPSLRSSPINVILTVSSIVDLCVLIAAIVVYAIPGVNTFLGYIDSRRLYRLIISGFYQSSLIAQTTSIYTLVLITVERFLAVVHPLQVHRLVTVRRALLLESMIIIAAILYNIPRFFEYQYDSNVGYVPLLRSDPLYFSIYYTSMYLITHFVCPFSTVAILNGYIFRTLRNARDERRSLIYSENGKCHPTVVAHDHQQRTTNTMVVWVTLIFGACNILPFVLNFLEATEPALFEGEWKNSAYLTLDISNVLVVIGSSTNAFVYYVYCNRYRRLLNGAFRRVCTCSFAKKSESDLIMHYVRSTRQDKAAGNRSDRAHNIESFKYEETAMIPLLGSSPKRISYSSSDPAWHE